MLKMFRKFFTDESGATMVEYGIMVALIAVVAIAAVAFLGQEVNEGFSEVGRILNSYN